MLSFNQLLPLELNKFSRGKWLFDGMKPTEHSAWVYWPGVEVSGKVSRGQVKELQIMRL